VNFGMRPLIAHCHLGLGKLYRGKDKCKQAREHLATATTMYREMAWRIGSLPADLGGRRFEGQLDRPGPGRARTQASTVAGGSG